MQPFESVMFGAFLGSYSYGAVRALFWPERFRISQIRFFSSEGLYFSDIVVFGLASVAAMAMVAHLSMEKFVPGHIILYTNLVLFVVFSSAHWTSVFRERKLLQAMAASPSSYKALGLRRVALIILMVALPITLPR